MTIYRLGDAAPLLPRDGSAWIAPDANVIGRVTLGKSASVWFGVTIRGDNDTITIGDGTNIQDGSVLHADPGFPLTIGRNCTIGHKAMVHGCTVEDETLIGMCATILNGARIGRNCLIGAGALIPERKVIPDGSLVVGSPGKVIRTLSAKDIEGLRRTAQHYQANAIRYRDGLSSLD